jgi:hypothetical protein
VYGDVGPALPTTACREAGADHDKTHKLHKHETPWPTETNERKSQAEPAPWSTVTAAISVLRQLNAFSYCGILVKFGDFGTRFGNRLWTWLDPLA